MFDDKIKQKAVLENQKTSPGRKAVERESRRGFIKVAAMSAFALGLGVPIFSDRLRFFEQNKQNDRKDDADDEKREDAEREVEIEKVFTVQKSRVKEFEQRKRQEETDQNMATLYEKETGFETVSGGSASNRDKQRLKELREKVANAYGDSNNETGLSSIKNGDGLGWKGDSDWLEKSGKLTELAKVERIYELRIEEISRNRGVPAEIIKAITTLESGGNSKAVSPDKQDEGLMQIRKGTQSYLGLKDPFHPYKNMDAGARYLRELYERFGSWELAIAAYNKGPGGLEKILKRKEDPSKLDYVKKVLTLVGHAQ